MNVVNIKDITDKVLNVVTDEGMKQLSREAVIEMLKKSGLDLVDVSNGNNPVYKILDYNKYLYKKKKVEKQNQSHKQTTKEVKFGLNIQPHDINTKLKNIKKFLANKDKVRIVIEMHGREVTRPEFAIALANNILSQIDNGKADSQVKSNGRTVSVVVKPL